MRLAILLSAATVATMPLAPASAATRDIPVRAFDRVHSSVPFDVRIHVGGAPSVVVDGPQRVLDRLDVHVEGNRLMIGMRSGSWWSSWTMPRGEHVVVSVTAPRLSGTALSGPGNVEVDRVRAPDFEASLSGPGNIRIAQLDAGRVDFDVSGPGDLTAAGRVGRARFSLSGPGNIRARELGIQDLDVSLSGPGNVDATVFGTAAGHLSGPGDIRIGGRPRCQISKSGPGDVRCG